MISNLALIDNPKVRELAFKIAEIEHVVDVRFFPTLRDELKELAGANSVTFTAITNKQQDLRRHFVITPEQLYNNDESHQLVVDQMAAKINAFYNEGNPEILAPIVDAVIIPEPAPEETPPEQNT